MDGMSVRESRRVPVLLIMFNRPDKVRQMISALRETRPARLFVAADGPRHDPPDDQERCAESRRALDEIDWPCEVRRLLHSENLGCKRGPEAAIDWFFSQVDAGIILEDDCLPTPDFFPFCGELLERFGENEQVMMISGFNVLGSWPSVSTSYLFGRTSPFCGWATWKRAWRHYDRTMSAWASRDTRDAIRARMSTAEYRLMRRLFDQVYAGELDAWDYGWSFAMLRKDGVAAIASHNMIKNIGFDKDATHTKAPWVPEARTLTRRVAFPLSHPIGIEASTGYEEALFNRRFTLYRRMMIMLPTGVARPIRTLVNRSLSLVVNQ